MMWVQEGRTALELARLGPGSEWKNAESAYPAVIASYQPNSSIGECECANSK